MKFEPFDFFLHARFRISLVSCVSTFKAYLEMTSFSQVVVGLVIDFKLIKTPVEQATSTNRISNWVDRFNLFPSFLNSASSSQCSADQFGRTLTDCNDWIYDTSVYKTTFSVEDDIVCSNGWKEAMIQSMYFMGVLVCLFFALVFAAPLRFNCCSPWLIRELGRSYPCKFSILLWPWP